MKPNFRCDNCNSQKASKKWKYFDEPISLQDFTYCTKSEVVIPFDQALPKDVQISKAKLILFLRTGHENEAEFWTRIRVLDKEDELVHWTYGFRYPQGAISYNSQTIQIPCQTTREIRVKSNHIQPQNCHHMKFRISGYLPK